MDVYGLWRVSDVSPKLRREATALVAMDAAYMKRVERRREGGREGSEYGGNRGGTEGGREPSEGERSYKKQKARAGEGEGDERERGSGTQGERKPKFAGCSVGRGRMGHRAFARANARVRMTRLRLVGSRGRCADAVGDAD